MINPLSSRSKKQKRRILGTIVAVRDDLGLIADPISSSSLYNGAALEHFCHILGDIPKYKGRFKKLLTQVIEQESKKGLSDRTLSLRLKRYKELLDQAENDDDITPIVSILCMLPGYGTRFVRHALMDDNPSIRLGAVMSLAHFPEEVARPLYRAISLDPDPKVRRAAKEALIKV